MRHTPVKQKWTKPRSLLARGTRLAFLMGLAVLLAQGALAQETERKFANDPRANAQNVGPAGRWHRARNSLTLTLTDEQREEIRRLESLGYLSGSNPMPEITGVTIEDPARVSPGLNFFTSGHFTGAVLMDMYGEVLHEWRCSFLQAWPDALEDAAIDGAEYWRWAHLFENGDVLAIFEGLGLIKVDRDSNLLWEHRGHEHHDLEVMPDGTIYTLTREAHVVPEISPMPVLEDFVTILDADGNVVREVSVLKALFGSTFVPAHLADSESVRGDVLHTNAIEVLDGRLADRIPAFKRGNVLLSMREISTIAVLDMTTEKLVWASSGVWLEQHDPNVLENGNILIFDNKGNDGRSQIVEFDPVTEKPVWTYQGSKGNMLFSQMCGASHRLPNGNTLITESDYGRAFEVTPSGDMVWEFLNPNRAGDDGLLIATLFDVVRLPEDFPTDWLK